MPSVAAEDVAPPPLACTVRDCGEPLHRVAASCRCARGHMFDVSRHGYVNLLQPQDRRSRPPGDSAAAVAARSRLLAAGVGAAAVTAVARVVRALAIGPRAVVVDLGCGGGELLGAITASATVHEPAAVARVASPSDATTQHLFVRPASGPQPADKRSRGDTETLIGIDLSTAA